MLTFATALEVRHGGVQAPRRRPELPAFAPARRCWLRRREGRRSRGGAARGAAVDERRGPRGGGEGPGARWRRVPRRLCGARRVGGRRGAAEDGGGGGGGAGLVRPRGFAPREADVGAARRVAAAAVGLG